MIAKHVPMKSVRKSDFAGLVKYITDEQSKQERVGYQAITNCHSDNPLVAATEVANTQAQNRRAASDKTYHLIISFRAGENPREEVLKAIEARICVGLGYGEHQRVSAAHHDTDNLHVHVAINKIHPTRYTIHDPYNDHKTLGQLCEKLEREFGLEADNHQAQKSGGENRAADMERHAGVESLLGWVQRECLAQIQSAKSWKELHQVLHDNGLALRLHGNGLVITDGAGTGVKASSIARDLSKPKLEAKLGAFEPSPEAQAGAARRPSRQYQARPVRSRVDTVELYARYQAEQRASIEFRAVQWAREGDTKHRLIEDAMRGARFKRAAIKLMVGGGLSKKLLYASTAKTLKTEIQKINQQHQKQRKATTAEHARQTWADWLRRKATEGDSEALAALRARESAQGLKGNTVAGQGSPQSAQGLGLADPTQDSITKKGTVIYRVGATAVRDDGDRLNVSYGATQVGLEAALRMARERYGDCITVNGTSAFKEQIARAAATANLPITFDDGNLERRRQALSNATTKESINDHAGRGRSDHEGTGSTEPAATSSHTRQLGRAARASGANAAGRARTAPGRRTGRKPDVARVGSKPPPQSQHRLRNLSQLGVVHIASGSEMLLPRDVPRHVEHEGAPPAHGLRRGVSRPAGIADPARSAVDRYIAEREAKRLKLFDIQKHVRYTDDSEGAAAYVGTRQIEGQSLALLERGEEVMVLPVDEATARRLKRVAVGESVTVAPQGTIKTKGRSR